MARSLNAGHLVPSLNAGVQVAFAPLPAAPKPVATKAAPAAREPSRELTASEQFLAQARAQATLQA